MKPEKIFIEGAMFNKPREGAPDFIKGSLLIRPEEFIPFMQKHKEYLSPKGWYTIDLKQSQGGSLYLELNTWKPVPKDDMQDVKNLRDAHNANNAQTDTSDFDSIPF